MQQDDEQRGEPSQGGREPDRRAAGRESAGRESASGDCASGEWAARFVILGQTSSGKAFRPSDWAERLAGVMAAFRPGKAGMQQHLGYSPYVVPSSQGGVRCVIVDPQLRNLEPMAYNFLLHFARDNDLVTAPLSIAAAGSDEPS